MTDKVFVKVNEGKIKGFKKKSTFSGIEYCSFLGVPYAQPILEHDRFKVRTFSFTYFTNKTNIHFIK